MKHFLSKKTFRKIIATCFIAIVITNTAFAENVNDKFKEGKLYYKIINLTPKEVAVVSQNDNWPRWNDSEKPTGSITIPATVTYIGNAYSVTSIGDHAFHDCTALTSVTIPNTVTSIGSEVFTGTILDSITIPKFVTDIAKQAFKNCKKLTKFKVEAGSNHFTAIDGVLFSKDTTTLIQYPASNSRKTYNIPNGVKTIGFDAFINSDTLTNVVIPNSVDSIAQGGFNSCDNLKRVTIGSGVVSIGNYAFFDGTKLDKLICLAETPPLLKGTQVFTNYNAILYVPKGKKAIYEANTKWNKFTNIKEFEYNPLSYTLSASSKTLLKWTGSETEINMKNDPILNEVDTIGEKAFVSNKYLKSITIGDSVKVIGYDAFAHSKALTNVVISNNVDNIAQGGFYSCNKLKQVIVGERVTDINGLAFNSKNLKKLIFLAENPPTLYNLNGYFPIFYNDTITLYVLKGCLNTYKNNANNNSEWKKYDKIKYKELEYTPLSYTLSEDGKTLVKWKGSEQYIDMTQDPILNEVDNIGKEAFADCYQLDTVIIGSGVTSIGEKAFYHCIKLTKVTIPTSVTSIGNRIFMQCKNISSIVSNIEDPTINNNLANLSTFGDGIDKTKCKLYVLMGTKDKYQKTTPWSEFANIVEFYNPASYVLSSDEQTLVKWTGQEENINMNLDSKLIKVDSIAKSAFADNSLKIKTIVIADSVTRIGESAFEGRTNLTSVTIPAKVTNIGSQAFYKCSNLQLINCKADSTPILGSNVFNGVDTTTCELKVPDESVDKYIKIAQWKSFLKINGKVFFDLTISKDSVYCGSTLSAKTEISRNIPTVGIWEIISGSGKIDNPTAREIKISDVESGKSVVLQYTIEYNNTVKTLTTTLTNGLPVVDAGKDISFYSSDKNYSPNETAKLNASKLNDGETGLWTKITANSFNISDTTNPNTELTNIKEKGRFLFRWTVTKTTFGTQCTLSDDMALSVGFVFTPKTVTTEQSWADNTTWKIGSEDAAQVPAESDSVVISGNNIKISGDAKCDVLAVNKKSTLTVDASSNNLNIRKLVLGSTGDNSKANNDSVTVNILNGTTLNVGSDEENGEAGEVVVGNGAVINIKSSAKNSKAGGSKLKINGGGLYIEAEAVKNNEPQGVIVGAGGSIVIENKKSSTALVNKPAITIAKRGILSIKGSSTKSEPDAKVTVKHSGGLYIEAEAVKGDKGNVRVGSGGGLYIEAEAVKGNKDKKNNKGIVVKGGGLYIEAEAVKGKNGKAEVKVKNGGGLYIEAVAVKGDKGNVRVGSGGGLYIEAEAVKGSKVNKGVIVKSGGLYIEAEAVKGGDSAVVKITQGGGLYIEENANKGNKSTVKVGSGGGLYIEAEAVKSDNESKGIVVKGGGLYIEAEAVKGKNGKAEVKVKNGGGLYIEAEAVKGSKGNVRVGSGGGLYIEAEAVKGNNVNKGVIVKSGGLYIEAEAVKGGDSAVVSIANGGGLHIEENANKGNKSTVKIGSGGGLYIEAETVKSDNESKGIVVKGGGLYIEAEAVKGKNGKAEVKVKNGGGLYIEAEAVKGSKGNVKVGSGGGLYIEAEAVKSEKESKGIVVKGGGLYIEAEAVKNGVGGTVETPLLQVDNGKVRIGNANGKKNDKATSGAILYYGGLLLQDIDKQEDTAIVVYSGSSLLYNKKYGTTNKKFELGKNIWVSINKGANFSISDGDKNIPFAMTESSSFVNMSEQTESNASSTISYNLTKEKSRLLSVPFATADLSSLPNTTVSVLNAQKNEWEVIENAKLAKMQSAFVQTTEDQNVTVFGGSLNMGKQTVTLNHEGEGWLLCGNPYASQINWDKVEKPAELSPAIYRYNAETKQFATYMNGISLNQAKTNIGIGEGFILNTSANATLNILPDVQQHIAPAGKGSKATQHKGLIMFTISNADNTLSDQTVLMLVADAKKPFDIANDAKKLRNINNANVYTLSDDKKELAINGTPLSNQTIPMLLEALPDGDYTLKASVSGMQNNLTINLSDELDKSKKYDLKTNQDFSFNHKASNKKHRFTITISGATKVNENERNTDIQVYSSGNKIYIDNKDEAVLSTKIISLSGQTVFVSNEQFTNHKTIVTNLQTGVYILNIKTKTGAFGFKVHIQE